MEWPGRHANLGSIRNRVARSTSVVSGGNWTYYLKSREDEEGRHVKGVPEDRQVRQVHAAVADVDTEYAEAFDKIDVRHAAAWDWL